MWLLLAANQNTEKHAATVSSQSKHGKRAVAVNSQSEPWEPMRKIANSQSKVLKKCGYC